MFIAATTAGPAAHVASSDASSPPRAEDVHAEQFAALFATAMNAAKPPVKDQKPEGTSDLDASGTADDAGSSSSETSSKDKANDPAVLVASTSSSSAIVRSLSALDPQLQARLSRVVNRMREETGHDVTVSETYRTQARQNRLFAQGRSSAGPVVTWTQHSKHTDGRAVDVVVDGGDAGPDAYRALQRIASEEGLGTLGARDPGHLELRGRGPRATSDATPQMPVEPADATGPGTVSIARLAQLARVAEVKPTMTARPAHVAQLASAASPTARNATGRSAPVSPATPTMPYGVTLGSREPHARVDVSSTPSVSGAAGVEAAARAERVLAARDSAPARSLSQITMSVDAGNGAADRVQVSMRGQALNATIDTADARAAQVMSARGDELARALDKQGVELQALRVRAAESTTGVSAAAQTQSSQGGSDAYSQSRFNRGDAWQQQQDQHERGRSQQQRQQRDDSRQQREQRGGRK